MEAVKEPLHLLDIEKELSGPGAEEALRRHDAVLLSLQRRLDEAMGKGVAPEEFQSVQMLSEANTIARKILRLAVRKGGDAQETKR